MTFDELKNRLQDNLYGIITNHLMFDYEFMKDIDESCIWKSWSVFEMSEQYFQDRLKFTIGNSARTYILEFLVVKHLIKLFEKINIENVDPELVLSLMILVKLMKIFMERLIDSCWDYIDRFWWDNSFGELLKDYWGIKGLC